MVFSPGETSKVVEIKIVDDNEWEPDEVFFVRLIATDDEDCIIGKRSICQVTILNDDSKFVIIFILSFLDMKKSNLPPAAILDNKK